jgi:histidinol-phosphate phosphatase family protein
LVKAIFFDRDGVICKERNLFYKGKPIISEKDIEWEKNVIKALKKISKLDYLLIIITNQSIIGKGILKKEKFKEITNFIHHELLKNNIKISHTYVCPHTSEENCFCRKPKIGLLKLAQEKFNIDLEKSYFIGDKTSDIQTGFNAGCKTILVKTGYSGEDKSFNISPDFIVEDLNKVFEIIK